MAKKGQVFYSAARIPGVGIALIGSLALLFMSVLCVSIGGVGGILVLGTLAPLATIGLIALDRRTRYPRLVLEGAVLAYRDAHETITMAASEIARVEGGERLVIVSRSGQVVELPAIAAPQYQVARGHDTYPDRVAEAVRSWASAQGAEPVQRSASDLSPDRVHAARVAVMATAVVGAAVILGELLRDLRR